MRIKPTVPLGAYPHDRLWGQVGSTPNKIRIKMMRTIVPIDMITLQLDNGLLSSQLTTARCCRALAFDDQTLFHRPDPFDFFRQAHCLCGSLLHMH